MNALASITLPALSPLVKTDLMEVLTLRFPDNIHLSKTYGITMLWLTSGFPLMVVFF